METYKNFSGDSGVTHFEIGDDFIDVKFKGKSTIYIYSNSKNGQHHIDAMKVLAVKGRGLCAYITQHPTVKNKYGKR